MDKKWSQYFPHETPRDIQVEAIDFAIDQFEKGKKYVIIEAPVGTGKSAIAITLSKYFQHHVSSQNKSTWLLTTQKILQQQYQKECGWLSSIWSKTNYECKKRLGVSCQLGLWINSIFQGTYCDCIYTKDKKSFLENEVSLTNVQFFLNHIEYGHGEIKQRKILIIDEAHNLDSMITDFVSVQLDKFIIQDYGIKWIGHNRTTSDVIKWITNSVLPKLIQVKGSYQSQIKLLNRETILTSPEGRNLMKKLDSIDRYICQLNRCLDRFVLSEWVMSANKDEDRITLKPIFASKFSQQQLFWAGEKVMLMSGTILDKDTYCRNVGIPPSDVAFISLKSPFDAKNRPVFIVSSGSMSYKNIDRSLPQIAKAINELINKDHRNDKGIIHCHTYKIANYLNTHLKTNRLLLHNSANRMEVYNFHLNDKKPTILLSPSLTEGIDLIDELSRFQIIVKIPFPFLGDEFVKQKMKRVPGWYEWETAKTVIQASGRSVRHEDDHSMTYILDSDFNFFYKRNEYMFPRWYKDALFFV